MYYNVILQFELLYESSLFGQSWSHTLTHTHRTSPQGGHVHPPFCQSPLKRL